VSINNRTKDGQTVQELNICKDAPEMAEHARFEDKNDPCDDGRAGIIQNTVSEGSSEFLEDDLLPIDSVDSDGYPCHCCC